MVSNDEQVLQKIRDARLLGVENDTEKNLAVKEAGILMYISKAGVTT